jgi:hypothetical protein
MIRSGGLIIAVLALAACSPKVRDSANPESHAPGTTLATVPGSCGSYPAGTPGVIRTFCDGTAVVKVNIAGVDSVLKGGTCEMAGPVFSLNLGVVSDNQLGGPKPDYVGISTPAAGPFTNGVLVVTLGGKAYTLLRNSGTAAMTGGTFSGTSMHGEAVTGSFSC